MAPMTAIPTLSNSPAFASGHRQGRLSFSGLGAMPLDVRLARNQLANRIFIDSVGDTPWRLAFARNNYERVEHLLSYGSFMVIGVAMPIVLGWIFNKGISRQLVKHFKLRPKGNPLAMPFQWIEHNGLKALQKNAPPPEELAKYGLTHINQLSGKLLNHIRNAKSAIILMDLLLMGVKGQFYWVKNKLMEKISGQKGFTGTFTEASEEYRKKKTAAFEKDKYKRLAISLTLGFGSALLLPALVRKALFSPKAIGKGVVGTLKKLLPAFDYSDAIFMSKWVLLWQSLFTYNLPSLMASRDENEFRERFLRAGVFDFFYFVGDDLISGGYAQHVQRKLGKQLQGVPLYKTWRLGRWKIPKAIPYEKIYKTVKGNRNSLAFKESRKIFWVGLAGTTLGMSIMTPLVNIWMTRSKIRREEAQMAKAHTQTDMKRPLGNTIGPTQALQWPTLTQTKRPPSLQSASVQGKSR